MSERRQRPKRGKVVRLSDYAWSVLIERKEGSIKETVDGLINELHDLTIRLEDILRSPTLFILPESRIVCDSEAEARGEAILRAVRKGKKSPSEKPVAVKVI
jgi:hypothetical protein